MRRSLDSLGPGYAGSVLAPDAKFPGFRMVQIFDDRNAGELNALIDEVAPKLIPAVQEHFKKLGLPVHLSVGAPRAAGLPEGARELRMEFRELADEQQKALFGPLHSGTGVQFHTLPVGKRLLVTFGSGSEELLKSWAATLSGTTQPGGAAVPPMSLPGIRIAIATMDLGALFSLTPVPEEDAGSTKRFFETLQTLSMSASVEGPVLHGEMRYPLETTLTAVKAEIDAKNASDAP
jgi:hypothetical protein